MSQTRILILEPDLDQRAVLAGALEAAGLSTSTTGAEDAAAWLATGLMALVVLAAPVDRDLLRRLHEAEPVPMVVTGANDDAEVLAALAAGADDCLRTSASTNELVARVQAVLRRGGERGQVLPARRQAPRDLIAVEVGPLRVDWSAQKATCAGQVLPLTPIELHLLYVLAKNVGRVVPRAMLSQDVWGVSEPVSGSLDIGLSRLRKKLAPVGLGPLLKTIRGVGYILSSELAELEA